MSLTMVCVIMNGIMVGYFRGRRRGLLCSSSGNGGIRSRSTGCGGSGVEFVIITLRLELE